MGDGMAPPLGGMKGGDLSAVLAARRALEPWAPMGLRGPFR